MNTEVLLQAADDIEASLTDQHPLSFDMGTYADYTDCGTVACVAGFIAHRVAPEKFQKWLLMTDPVLQNLAYDTECRPFEIAREALGLDGEDATKLFAPGHGQGSLLEAITDQKRHVPAMLRWMAETGRLDWEEAHQTLSGRSLIS